MTLDPASPGKHLGAPLGVEGALFYPGFLSPTEQAGMRDDLRQRLRQAPFYRPAMPRTGKPLSVQMTNLGPQGWYCDRHGYRYIDRHPATGAPWPAMPPGVIQIWHDLTGSPTPPDACLVNYYDAGARMGLHRDQDEQDLSMPILSISLGDTAVFRLGGPNRRDKTRSLRLSSGDVLVLAGPARACFHGIDRILPGTSGLLPQGGRLNLTIRRARRPPGG